MPSSSSSLLMWFLVVALVVVVVDSMMTELVRIRASNVERYFPVLLFLKVDSTLYTWFVVDY